MSAPAMVAPGADFGPDQLTVARLRQRAALLHELAALGSAEYPEMVIGRWREWADKHRLRIYDRLDDIAEAARALDALADEMVRKDTRA